MSNKNIVNDLSLIQSILGQTRATTVRVGILTEHEKKLVCAELEKLETNADTLLSLLQDIYQQQKEGAE